MNAPTPERLQAEISLSHTLSRAGQSVDFLGKAIAQLEDQILRSGPPLVTGTDAQTLQSLDHLQQMTNDIVALLDQLAAVTPRDVMVARAEVIAPLKLEAMQAAIGRGDFAYARRSNRNSTSKVDLF